MKKSSFFAGFLTALMLLGIGGTALAYQTQATLDYPGITVTLDGKMLELKDAQGVPVDPFTMEDTTYLPVRAISNALGLDVDWDQQTRTVVLTSPEGELSDDVWENLRKLGFYHDLGVAAHFLQGEFERIERGVFDSTANTVYTFGANKGKSVLQLKKEELAFHDETVVNYTERLGWILDENDRKLVDEYTKLSSQISCYISAFEAGTTSSLTYDEFDSMNGVVLSDMLFDDADKRFIELMDKRSDWTDTASTEIPAQGEDDGYLTWDCYPDFSVPSFENIVGKAAFDHAYILNTGDSIAYYYNLEDFDVPDGVNFAKSYRELLGTYGFELQSIENERQHYTNDLNGLSIVLYMEDKTDQFVVLVMSVAD